MTVAYDLDGVLCEAPPANHKPWRKMKGPERAAHQDMLKDWYGKAKGLYWPTERAFHVITARSEANRAITERWLARHFGGKNAREVVELHMFSGARTIANVVEYKARVLKRIKATDYSEDNRDVVRALRRAVPECRVWHYKNGQMLLDYREAPL